ncbi:protein of unknown function [Agrobacterium pusense]|uniref:Uncharacterized protein n=1 Tax=Agrobacterium pusense TaxID=648995 RepID=U4Q4A4_9HYPH|nr:protein of unknown function [Agrobacterium pusense]
MRRLSFNRALTLGAGFLKQGEPIPGRTFC